MKKPRTKPPIQPRKTLDEAYQWQPWIDVNAECLRLSKRRNFRHCIVATGIKRSLPGAIRTEVTAMVAKFNFGGFRYTYEIPAWVQAKVLRYDDPTNPKIEPFRFRFPKPSGVRPETNRPSSTKPRVEYGKGKYAQGKKKTRKSCQPNKARRWQGLKFNPNKKAA